MSKSVWVVLLCLSGCQAKLPCWCGVGAPRGESEALAGSNAAEALEQRFGGVYPNPDAEARMARVGDRLCRQCGIETPAACFRLLDSSDLNALSLPGPRIYITRTLYDRLASDDLLSAVIAHELAHVAARDHYKPRGADADEALQREIAADAGAVRMLESAGVDPAAMQAVLIVVERALPPDWALERTAALATAHPLDSAEASAPAGVQ